MFCKYCGKPLDADSFCTYCGKKNRFVNRSFDLDNLMKEDIPHKPIDPTAPSGDELERARKEGYDEGYKQGYASAVRKLQRYIPVAIAVVFLIIVISIVISSTLAHRASQRKGQERAIASTPTDTIVIPTLPT